MPSKNKTQNFIVPLVVYPYDLMVSFGQTNGELKKTLNKYDIGNGEDWAWENSQQQGKMCINELNQGILRLRTVPSTPEQYGYLQHEIFHYVMIILERMGMKYKSLISDEAFSYLIQYLTTAIYSKIK